jgi:hypothetical protein
MKKVLPVILIFYFSFSVSLWAQEVMPLSLQEALDATLINNKEIVLAKLEEEGATARFRQTNAVFLPQNQGKLYSHELEQPLKCFWVPAPATIHHTR